MKIFYSAYTCKGNVGDLLINKYQIEEYAKYADVYVDLTGMPQYFANCILDGKNPKVHDFVSEYNMSYRGFKMFKVLSLLKTEGFTHFTKSPGPYAILSLPFKRLLVRLLGAWGYLIARKYGMKVLALGIDLNMDSQVGWLYKLNLKYFNQYNLLGLRSKRNKMILESSVKNTCYCPDMAFLCPDLKESYSLQRKKVALSFRQVDDIDKLIHILQNVCEHYTSIGYEIHIVYQVAEDDKFCKLLLTNLSKYHPKYRNSLISFSDLHDYEQYDIVFSNRLHVLLMGAMHGAVPFAILSKDLREHKIIDVFDSVFEERFWMYIDDGNGILDRLLSKNFSPLKKQVYHSVLIQKRLCEETIRKQFLQN